MRQSLYVYAIGKVEARFPNLAKEDVDVIIWYARYYFHEP